MGFPGGSDSKESGCNVGDLGSIPGWEDPPEKGKKSLSKLPLYLNFQATPKLCCHTAVFLKVLFTGHAGIFCGGNMQIPGSHLLPNKSEFLEMALGICICNRLCK